MNSHIPTASTSELAPALCNAMADIHRRGWCEGTGGNFSCVVSREPLLLLMAPSGVDKGSVQPTDLIQVDPLGAVRAGSGRASAETLLHLTIVETTGAGAVLHTHSQAATLLSRHAKEPSGIGQQDPPGKGEQDQVVRHLVIEGLEMLKGLEGIKSHEQQIALPVLANDQDLERLSACCRPHLSEAPFGILISGHGLYAWGSDLEMARRHLEILEFLLEQHWRELLLQALTAAGAKR
jgi:methylthioribulose-1-phosphate dehydratase